MPPPVSIHNAAFDAAHTFLDEDLVMKVAELAVVMRESNAYLSAALATTSRNQSVRSLNSSYLFLVGNHDANGTKLWQYVHPLTMSKRLQFSTP
jgi:hypothetical protein